MASLEAARKLFAENDLKAAKRMVNSILDDDPDNEAALNFALELAEDEEERQVLQQCIVQLHQRQAHRASLPTKNYLPHAIVLLVTLPLGGFLSLLLAAYFRHLVKKDQEQGYVTENAGCIDAVLWGAVAVVLLTMIVLIVSAIVAILSEA